MQQKTIIAVLTSLIILNGCQKPPEQKNDLTTELQNNTQIIGSVEPQKEDQIVSWITPTPIASLKLFRETANKNDPLQMIDQNTKYYQTGTVRTGQFAGAKILLVLAGADYPYWFPPTLRFLQQDQKLILLKQYSTEIDPKQFIKKNIIIPDTKTEAEISNLFESRFSIPEEIKVPATATRNSATNFTLKLEQKTSVFFSPKNLQPVFNLEDGRTVYMEKNGNNTWSTKDARIFQSNGFFLPIADSTVAVYSLKLPFYNFENENYNPQITWNNNQQNNDRYGFYEGSSCGFREGTYGYITNDKLQFETMNPPTSILTFPFSKNDISPIGKTNTGDTIYSFKDDNNPYIKAFYEQSYKFQSYHINGQATVSFEEFKAMHPFIFWLDPFNRLYLLINWNAYIPSPCAGKPIIYLYPKTKQAISVKVGTPHRLFTSYPEGSNGWNVIAKPTSQIFDVASGKTVPYLFWEDLINYKKPQTGFVIDTKNAASFLQEKLQYMGLNQTEIRDFNEFWLPKITATPYARISFLQTDEMNHAAPLEIMPQPETLIRVFMDFEGLKQPISVPLQIIKPQIRSGFSVVEWGGKLKN